MKRTLLFIVLLTPILAFAREQNGAPDLIRSPHNARPTLVLQGETFSVELLEEAALLLRSGEQTIPLTATWTRLPGGNVTGECRVPPGVAAGTYTLEATSPTRADQNTRSVYIYDAFPEDYRIAHIAEAAASSDSLRKALRTANESGAAFVLITAPFAKTDTRESLQLFSDALDESTVPTFVCPQQIAQNGDLYTAFFGTTPYAFRFGKDAYLAFDASHRSLSDAPAEEHRLRRQFRPARWSIGFTPRYDATMNMRSQLTLFVDDPLDVLITGAATRAEQSTIPWGLTDRIATVGSGIRLIEVSERGVE